MHIAFATLLALNMIEMQIITIKLNRNNIYYEVYYYYLSKVKNTLLVENYIYLLLTILFE